MRKQADDAHALRTRLSLEDDALRPIFLTRRTETFSSGLRRASGQIDQGLRMRDLGEDGIIKAEELFRESLGEILIPSCFSCLFIQFLMCQSFALLLSFFFHKVAFLFIFIYKKRRTACILFPLSFNSYLYINNLCLVHTRISHLMYYIIIIVIIIIIIGTLLP